jgi:zinc protease
MIVESAVARLLFPSGHPYRTSWTDAAAVAAVRHEDIEAFFRDHVTPDQVLVIAVGDMEWRTLFRQVERSLSTWQGRAVAERRVPFVDAPPAGPRMLLLDNPGARQCTIRVVALAPSNDSNERVPLQLLSTALGGLLSSRLYSDLRETHGYSYAPHTWVELERGAGRFEAIATVATDRTGETLRGMMRDIETVRNEVLSDQELAVAQQAFFRDIAQHFSTVSNTSNALVSLAIDRRPLREYWDLASDARKVTSQSLRTVAAKYLAAPKLRIVVMGDETGLRHQLDGYEFEVVRVPPAAMR